MRNLLDISDNITETSAMVAFMAMALKTMMDEGGTYCEKINYGAELIFNGIEARLDGIAVSTAKLHRQHNPQEV